MDWWALYEYVNVMVLEGLYKEWGDLAKQGAADSGLPVDPKGLREYSLRVNPCWRAWVLISLLNMSLPVKYSVAQWYWSYGTSLRSSRLVTSPTLHAPCHTIAFYSLKSFITKHTTLKQNDHYTVHKYIF